MPQAATFDPGMIFPELAGKRWAHNLALNDLFVRMKKRDRTKSHPTASALRSVGLMARIHQALKVDCSWGGHGEGRSVVLKETYLSKTKTWTHLGVDFYVPAGILVAYRRRAQVLHIDNDTPEPWGWGTRVFLRVVGTDTVLLFAHLSKNVPVSVGEILNPKPDWNACVFARVGERHENGGWFPHLHVQAMDLRRYREFRRNPAGLDGYGHPADLVMFPDPLPWLMPPA